MFCAKCGNQLDEGAAFCPKCGTAVDAATPVTAQNAGQPGQPPEGGIREARPETQEVYALVPPEQPVVVQAIAEPPAVHYTLERNTIIVDSSPSGPEKRPPDARWKDLPGRFKSIFIAAGVLIVVLITAGIFLFNKNNQVRDYWFARHNQLAGVYPIIIREMKFGNTGKNNSVLTQPGDRLDSADMRYLQTYITYESYWTPGYKLPLTVTIYNAQGRRETANGTGLYTYQREASINEYTGTLNIGGWGNESRSTWPRGEYRVEVWYNDVCIGSKTAVIY